MLTRRQLLKSSDEKFNAVSLEIGGKNASTLFDLQQRDVIPRGVVIDSDWFSATSSFDFYSICVYF